MNGTVCADVFLSCVLCYWRLVEIEVRLDLVRVADWARDVRNELATIPRAGALAAA